MAVPRASALMLVLLWASGTDCAAVAAKAPVGGALGKLDSPYLRGGLWQATALLATYPIDTLKTRLQIPFGAPGEYQRSAGAFAVRRVNALQAPFWSGVGASLLSQVPSMAIMATTFGACRSMLEEKAPKMDALQVDILSIMAGTGVASLWSAPCEAVKCTFQSGMYTSSLKSAVRAIHKERGNYGFLQGYTAQVARDLPFFSIMFASYELMRGEGPSGSSPDHWKQDAALGGAAGAVAALVTTPFDVARTQATMRTWGGKAVWREANSLTLLPHILKEQGVRGVMAGAVPRVGHAAIGAAFFFMAFERYFDKPAPPTKGKKGGK
ncbi:mitochondrial carrier domain-containing protein [Baffinella frigidus]|nr:mitochondrial carrier domain-containing protein [Cryptophyta sp. CCMP2293]|eukprot:CAMPEP_0180137498 /NCGR_PEP_ID=MMETSP0986-20121125/12248_1 /TAXON_ID=697907 /ORGANISM="non described non described, Strain CCMP2293" /LENGTH=324 /DNA_ID=CAMNT_0022078971 /DNA_START=36 /DNA_END=1010 /DNA_ORIENTATION=-